MKPIRDDRLDEFEELAADSIKHIRAFFTYLGENQAYYHKAKVAMGVIASYGRLRSSETNRMAVEMALGKSAGQRQIEG